MTRLSAAFLCVLTTAAGVHAADKIVIAHRGASGYLPEHTLEAYAMAYALGADYIEPDLVMTKDGRFICLHDIHLEGTTNVEQVFPARKRDDGRWCAADFTLDEIKRLNAHERVNKRFPQDKGAFEVPTFEEMVELIQGLNKATGRDVGVYPELKQPGWHKKEGLPMEEAFLAVCKRYGYEGPEARIFVQCFEPTTLEMMRKDLGSELPQIMLVADQSADRLLPDEGLDYVATIANGIGPDKELLAKWPDLVKRAHKRGLGVHPYTLRADSLPKDCPSFEEEVRLYYFDHDIDAMFTDHPDKVRTVIDAGP
ncbi:MAG: glycerophosphodiester phosphodiesterase [bacterium]|nr:glycerophosphodiester phosphodiesterase [bacterium]